MRLALNSSTVLLVAIAMLVGCKNTLPKSTEIARMRVLGSKLEVVGDETRTSPRPGEQVKVSLVTVFPKLTETTQKVQSMFISCTAPNRFTGGIPVCQEILDLATSSGTSVSGSLAKAPKVGCSSKFLMDGKFEIPGVAAVECVTGDPVTEVPVAKDFKASQKLLIGVVCERGEPFIDLSSSLMFGCDKNSGETIRINSLIPVQHSASDENHNPDINALDVKWEVTVPIDGGLHAGETTWATFDPGLMASETNCDPLKNPTTLPELDYLEHTMTLSYKSGARLDNKQPKDLEFSVYATGGELERRFTLYPASDDQSLSSALKWTPPDREKIRGRSQLVRFFFTVRDHNGGFATMTRAVCVLGPAAKTTAKTTKTGTVADGGP